jgi:hypothetical protein
MRKLGGNENKWAKESSKNVRCTDQNSNAVLSEHKNQGYTALNLHRRVNKISNNETYTVHLLHFLTARIFVLLSPFHHLAMVFPVSFYCEENYVLN